MAIKKRDTMETATTMQRYEMKYLLSEDKAAKFLEETAGRIRPDDYGSTSIASLYYDTSDRRIVRASVENPPFKEKIRLRSYGPATENSTVFLELKRKAGGIVYKRRVPTTQRAAERFFKENGDLCERGQIAREISYFKDYYGDLVPSCLIICERTAYYEPWGNLRLTVDRRPRYRTERLDLSSGMDGTPLLPRESVILEVKVQEAMPLWLSETLARLGIYKTSFSKYGETYKLQNTIAARERPLAAERRESYV